MKNSHPTQIMRSGLFGILICASCPLTVNVVNAAEFERDVAPILIKRCLECHNERSASGGLVLTNKADFRKGGDSGPVLSKKVSDSLLLQRIVDAEMPPPQRGESQKLPDDEIQILADWIKQGAQWPQDRILDQYERTSDVRGGRDWWSFQPVKRPKIPAVQNRDRIQTPVDSFILKRLETQQLEPAAIAVPRVRIRRLYFDLIGLPPTRQQIDRFESTADRRSWDRLIDDLLQSDQFAERWARHWLDVVRFAETVGYERDQELPNAWKYRDWVVGAIKSDMPINKFIVDQIAGDQVNNRSVETVTATGFLRLGTWNDEPNEPQDYKYERLEDLVHSTSSAFLGLTVKCARCHDHKFDPIPQEDYYRFAAAFWNGPIEPRDRKLLGGPTATELGFENVLGWTDVRQPNKPMLHVLKNGERSQPLQKVSASALSFTNRLDRNFSNPKQHRFVPNSRLQLAKWIAHHKNPLTARVFVNRIWQHHFGEGLVRTPNSFGYRGEKPTHPKLLDWLASELIDNNWSANHIHRLILRSSTWQQSSSHQLADEYEKRDASNRLLWKSHRNRLDAEALRDSILSACGDLDLKVGGPGFKPDIAAEALEGLSRKKAAWVPSPPKEQRRRSLYSFSKRGLLPPLMTTFDLCDSSGPCGQRNVTTVPPQALALLNNRFVHRCSQSLAEKVQDDSNDIDVQIREIWSRTLGRLPTKEESDLSRQHLRRQLRRFTLPKQPEPNRTTKSPAESSDQLPTGGLVLHLRAASGVETDANGRVKKWKSDRSATFAMQDNPAQRPSIQLLGFNGQPALKFRPKQFLKISTSLLNHQTCTLICVALDEGGLKHRELISNWNGAAGNSTSSLFLGLTGQSNVRFSDHFHSALADYAPGKAFILSAINRAGSATIFQGQKQLANQSALPTRNLNTQWVIGQQGNIDGEYWNGAIAELLVYSRALSDSEFASVMRLLSARYGIQEISNQSKETVAPNVLALASLVHVLMNSNEFLYID